MNSITSSSLSQYDQSDKEEKEYLKRIPEPVRVFLLRSNVRTTRPTHIPIRCRPWYLFVKIPAIVLITLVLARAMSEVWYAALIIGALFFLQAKPSYYKNLNRDFQRRKANYETSLTSFVELCSRVSDEQSIKAFNKARRDVDIAQAAFLDLPSRAEVLAKQIFARAEEQQLNEYLCEFLIEDASISGFGPGKKEALRHAGIETAADIRGDVEINVVGIGIALKESLLAWRNRCEADFVFDRRAKSLLVALDDTKRDLVKRRDRLREFVLQGHYRLEQLRPAAVAAAGALAIDAADLAYRLEQFRSDYEIAGGTAYDVDRWQEEKEGPLTLSAIGDGIGDESDAEASARINGLAEVPEQPDGPDSSNDELLDAVIAFVLSNRRASISLVQRTFSIGYNRAARLLETMEERGLVSPMGANGNRDVLAKI